MPHLVCQGQRERLSKRQPRPTRQRVKQLLGRFNGNPFLGIDPAVLGIHLLKACSTGVDTCAVTIMGVLLGVLPVAATLQLVVEFPDNR